MTGFDERFADRVREAFDAYEEPPDEAVLARLQTALATGTSPAPDRLAAVPVRSRRWLWGIVAGLAALALVGGAWLWSGRSVAPVSGPTVVEVRPTTPDASGSTGLGIASPEEAAATSEAVSVPEAGRGQTASTRTSSTSAASERPPPQVVAASVPPRRAPEVEAAGPGAGAGREALVMDRLVARPLQPALPHRPARTANISGPGFYLGPVRERTSGFGLVVASAVSGDRPTGGAGLAAGLEHERKVARGVSVSGGALLAYGRFDVDPSGPSAADAVAFTSDTPNQPIDVTTESTMTSLAVEVPLDVVVGLAETRAGRLGVGLGITSAVYVVQRFEDEGLRIEGTVVPQVSGDPAVRLSSEPFALSEDVPALSEVDLARDLDLTVRLGGRVLAAEAYGRIPLLGTTRRDLPITTLGLRLRYRLR